MGRVRGKRALERELAVLKEAVIAKEAELAPTRAEQRAVYDGMVLKLRAKLAARLAELGIVVKEPEVLEKGPQVEKVVVARKKIPYVAKTREPDKLAVGFSEANSGSSGVHDYGDVRGSSEAEIWKEAHRRYGPSE